MTSEWPVTQNSKHLFSEGMSESVTSSLDPCLGHHSPRTGTVMKKYPWLQGNSSGNLQADSFYKLSYLKPVESPCQSVISLCPLLSLLSHSLLHSSTHPLISEYQVYAKPGVTCWKFSVVFSMSWPLHPTSSHSEEKLMTWGSKVGHKETTPCSTGERAGIAREGFDDLSSQRKQDMEGVFPYHLAGQVHTAAQA